jgi:hypothetical protein
MLANPRRQTVIGQRCGEFCEYLCGFRLLRRFLCSFLHRDLPCMPDGREGSGSAQLKAIVMRRQVREATFRPAIALVTAEHVKDASPKTASNWEPGDLHAAEPPTT